MERANSIVPPTSNPSKAPEEGAISAQAPLSGRRFVLEMNADRRPFTLAHSKGHGFVTPKLTPPKLTPNTGYGSPETRARIQYPAVHAARLSLDSSTWLSAAPISAHFILPRKETSSRGKCRVHEAIVRIARAAQHITAHHPKPATTVTRFSVSLHEFISAQGRLTRLERRWYDSRSEISTRLQEKSHS